MSKSYLHSFIHSETTVRIYIYMSWLIDWLIDGIVCLDTVLSIGVRERTDSERNIFVIQREKLMFWWSKTQKREFWDRRTCKHCWLLLKIQIMWEPKSTINLEAYRTLLTSVSAIYIKRWRWGLNCDCPKLEHFILAAVTHSSLC